MANYEMLNNVAHQNVRVITERSAKYGDNVHLVMTFPFEFRRIQHHYPIFFQKDSETGKFSPIALFGFEQNENLFLNDAGWDASYVPLMIRRHPFLIGYQKAQNESGPEQSVVSIDMSSPRISETDGEALFLPHGGTSEYLASMIETLEDLKVGNEMNDRFVDALLELDLIESVSMEVELNDGSKRQLIGLYTIDEERLETLGGEELEKLHRRQFLQPVFMILASLSSFRTLIDKRNERLAIEQ